MMNISTLRQNILEGHYQTSPIAATATKQEKQAFRSKIDTLHHCFMRDVLAAYEMKDNVKTRKAFEIAYSHSNHDYMEMLYLFAELTELLEDEHLSDDDLLIDEEYEY